MRKQFWVLERGKWQLIWEEQQGLSAQAASTKAHRWPYPEPPLQPWTSTHPSGLYWMRKVKSIRSFSPQHEGSARWLWPWADVLQPGSSSRVMAVVALLIVVHLLQASYQQTTFSASGFAHTLFQTVVTWSRGEQGCGRSRGQEAQQPRGASSNFTICPSCLQSVAWQPKTPRRCALPSTVTQPAQAFLQKTSLPGAFCSPKEPSPNLCPTAHLESNQGGIWWSWDRSSHPYSLGVAL